MISGHRAYTVSSLRTKNISIVLLPFFDKRISQLLHDSIDVFKNKITGVGYLPPLSEIPSGRLALWFMMRLIGGPEIM